MGRDAHGTHMAVKAVGSSLSYGDTADYASVTTWTPLAGCKNFKPPKPAAKDIDITTLDSPNETEEMLPGLAKSGTVEATLRYDPVQSAAVYAMFRAVKGWKILYPDGSGWKFNGYISEFGDEELVNGEIIMSGVKMTCMTLPVKFGS